MLSIIRHVAAHKAGKQTDGNRSPIGLGGFVSIGLALAVAGCGVSYNSPSVQKRNDELPVSVIEMTPKSIAYANAQIYVPKSLPEVFYYAASGASGVRGAGAMPAAPYIPTERRTQLEYRPLPDIEPRPYRIDVGDVLLLATRGNGTTVEQLSGLLAAQSQRQGYTVRGDGSIAIPEIGSVQLAGLTIQGAEDQLFQVLVQNQFDPSFSLEVAEFNSKKVAIGGAVRSPTLVPITPTPLTLGDALIAAGGVGVKDEEFASIRIYRDGTLYQIPLETYRAQPELQKKFLTAGDAVFIDTSYNLDRALEFYQAQIDVISLRSKARSDALSALATEIGLQRASLEEGRSNFERRETLGAEDRDYVYLSGEVNSQGRFALPYNQQATLADVLYGEGGFDNTTGDPTEIYVLRSSQEPDKAGEVVAYHLNARNAANTVLATRFQMRPNDVVFIEEQPITKWGRAMQQALPTLLNTAARGLN